MESFADILTRAENPMAAAMLLMLAWIASCDGDVAEEELDGLRAIAASGKVKLHLAAVIDIARDGRTEDFQLACEVLRELEPKHRRLMLQMAVGMALEDQYLTTTEGHIVRFLADALSQTPDDLDSLFREMTGEMFPATADPSSVDWWESRERRSRTRPSSTANGTHTAPTPDSAAPPDMRRWRDLAVLGLDEAATVEQIKEAYRRMAKVHHPDRFASLGPEAVTAAEVSFRRIRAAYGRLVSA